MDAIVRFNFAEEGIDTSHATMEPCNAQDGREIQFGQVHRFDEPVYSGNGIILAWRCHKCGAYRAPKRS